MAPLTMFWRYLTLMLLLGIPSSRILSSATHNNPSGEDAQQIRSQSQDPLVEKIISQLSGQKTVDSKVRQQQKVQSEDRILDGLGHPSSGQDGFSKKDKSAAAVDSGNQGLNLQEKEPNVPVEPSAPEEQTNKDTSSGTDESQKTTFAAPGRYEAHQLKKEDEETSKLLSSNDTTFAVFVGVGVAAGFVGLMMAGICYHKFRKHAKAASDVEYPAYGVTGPMKEKIPSPGDRKLAQSAQMYHYQHQKQQMIAMEKANGDMKHDASDDDSEEDNVEGDYTVYECPGLAPTGEMEVINPLFRGAEETTDGTEAHTPALPDTGNTED